ncbi:proton channel OtopLc-like [Melitaea cinxia]|uniref:proton channel OtopLc-like n=1 Tax=Melitaea cinxia TaxID=113334 RepID=UPI001E272C5F|nr:proton channel OtopLc-like [Melitaea cinxia]
MSPGKSVPLCEATESRPGVIVTDMDTVQEENDNDSDESSYSDIRQLRERTKAMVNPGLEQLLQNSNSQPNSRGVSNDIEVKLAANLNTRRPSAIIAAFRRPSQALALCAATQRRFLSEMTPHSRTSVASTHESPPSAAELLGHEALSKALSALYAKLLVVLGLAFPVTEVIANGVPDAYYRGFYLYLYLVSLLFVIFLYANLIRERTFNTILNSHVVIEKDEKFSTGKATPNEKPKQKETISRYGSFYLRLGAIAFGIGSMVYSGLEFGEYFEMTDRCRSFLSALTPALRMALTIVQMQFIFLTNKDIKTGSHKMIQRFGLMHLIATNMCEWLYVLVQETKHEIHHLEHSIASKSNASHSEMEDMPCKRSNVMGALVQNASPFLFPCTIEYSLICAVILYEMWKEVKCTPEDIEKKLNYQPNKSRNNSVTPEKILQQFAGMLGVSSPHGSRTTLHHFSVDCSHAHRGLFAGILVIVITIISLIMFFVLVNNPNTVNDAIFEVNICELILYSLSILASATALKQMRELSYKRKSQAVLGLDTSLLILAQSGMFVYCMFSLIGCHHTMNYSNSAGLTGFFSEFLSLNQTILQSLFIIDAWWRRSSTSEQRRKKPGRQLVTFLLVANMAMWAINTLEKNRAEFRPAHLAFYGPWAWTIITHVSMPLAIFYRFHSTICLFEIWKNCFKNKPLYLNI